MAYLGVNPSNPDLTRTAALPRDAERFSGNGSTTNFTLSRSLYGATDAQVVVENVNQEPIVAYDIVGNQLVFTEAPPSGTNNIYVVYRAVQGAQVTLPDGSVSYNKLANNIRLFTVDNYIANSSISTYALSEAPADANTLAVSIDGIVQRAPINYTTTANTITFTSAPPTGANVHIKHLGFRSSSVVTAIPAGTTITQPVLSNPTITLAAQDSSFKGNVALYSSDGANKVGQFGATSSGQVQLDVGANTLSIRSSTIALANVNAFTVANTSGAVGLTVDAAGRLSTPYRPAFAVRGAQTGTITGGSKLTFTDSTAGSTVNVIFNTGGAWDNTQSRFNAPVAGKYVFMVHMYTQSALASIQSIAVRLNGAQMGVTDAFIFFQGQNGGSNTDNGVAGSFMINLAVNDYIEMFVRDGAPSVGVYSGHTWFQGYFLG